MTIEVDYEALSVETLQRYLGERQEENLNLDFKTVGSPDLAQREDRRSVARALSGFANANGGLIVWGVNARKDDEGIDRVMELRGVGDATALVARLNELTGQAINPIADGIRHRRLGMLEGNREFAVTLVPESDAGPHMAKLGENRYYKRSGGSFLPMEHYEVADMFGRRQRPKLELTARPRSNGHEIIVGLKNTGRAVARAPYLVISTDPPFQAQRLRH